MLIKAPLYRKKQRHEPISIKTRVLAVLTETFCIVKKQSGITKDKVEVLAILLQES